MGWERGRGSWGGRERERERERLRERYIYPSVESLYIVCYDCMPLHPFYSDLVPLDILFLASKQEEIRTSE